MKKHLWINGEHVEAKEYKSLITPYSKELLADVAVANEKEITKAIDAAENAFEKMRDMHAYDKADILNKVAYLLKEKKEFAAQLIAKEAGKPIKAATSEVDRTIMTYTFAAEEARRMTGETIMMDAAPGGENRTGYTVFEPLGIVGAITPFNFPMNLVAHKLGPALAAGNTVVLKPATQTPLSSYFIAELFDQAGLPKGALNVVTGSGKTIGDLFTTDNRIKALTFTGSPNVGKALKERAGMRKTLLELGSNSGVILDKHQDIVSSVKRCVQGAFSYSGQVCISVQRLYVHEEIYDDVISELIHQTKSLVTGDPLNEKTDVASLISEEDVERTLNWIEEALNDGAKLVHGGKSIGHQMVEPTVLTNVSDDCKLSREEAFAPIIIVNTFKELDEAISRLNNSKYGLQAGIFTDDIHKAFKAAKKIHAGGIMINDIPTFRVDHMPYGGVKDSGFGREGIKYAVKELSEMKFICINHIE
ncbi:aldehyde dehydrogenase family protein [Bacillus weihaiensis]|uniref:Aldehyde dehydrogenase n=1 Tax=Bacillus weihaiensis TaxID=1547283 RepID=A0A1L3MR36_9BACI|nr:aldehyde dehydrogenase family protein [Bacillus weihaiensis]APH04714.1 aldehyde dehydrogenase [Bacillus weihaiensis]